MYDKSNESSNTKAKDEKNKVLSCVGNQEAVIINVLELRALIAYGINENLNLLHLIFGNLYL